MNKLFNILLLSFLLSCQPSEEAKEASSTDVLSAQQASNVDTLPAQQAQNQGVKQPLGELARQPLKQYSDVAAMIEGTDEYHQKKGTFKIISQQPLHIQVSTPTYDGDLEETIRQQVLGDIIYVGFRIFAQTKENEIKITSIPLKGDNPKLKDLDYLQDFKQTATLKRSKAKVILEKYYGHSDFTKLFGEQVEGTYKAEIPNMQMKRMLSNDMGEPTLDSVFSHFQQSSHNLLPDS
jgi:hypothetical protein